MKISKYIMKVMFFFVIFFCLVPLSLTVDAVPPLERIPLLNISVSGKDNSNILNPDEQVIIRTEYDVIYPNTEFIIIFQITNENNQVVALNWIEVFQNNPAVNYGYYICGDEICLDERALPEDYVCGEDICEGSYPGTKFAETSWLPLESGNYEIVIFVWESIDNPTALSAPMWTEVTVEELMNIN